MGIVAGIYGIVTSDWAIWLKILVVSAIILSILLLIYGAIILLYKEEPYTKLDETILFVNKWILYIIVGVPIVCLGLCIVGTFIFLTVKAILNLFGIDIYTIIPF